MRNLARPLWTTDLGPKLTFVRFGSKADICAAIRHVRFTPDNDRESGFPQTVMSALPLKADMCGAMGNVCFGPIADITRGDHTPVNQTWSCS
jgi:hypothetical protein